MVLRRVASDQRDATPATPKTSPGHSDACHAAPSASGQRSKGMDFDQDVFALRSDIVAVLTIDMELIKQLRDQFAVAPDREHGLHLGIKLPRRLFALAAEQQANRLIVTGIAVEVELACQMPELMRGHFDPDLIGEKIFDLHGEA